MGAWGQFWNLFYLWRAPWDVGGPRPELVRLVESGRLEACPAIDLGCGIGENVIYLAKQGFEVMGVDISSRAIAKARRKAQAAGISPMFLVGDCAHFEDKNSGQPIPPRAHTGVRQARIAAHNILADIWGRDKKPYLYSKPAEMVSLGAFKAMFRFHSLRLYGFPARLIWVGAYSFLITGAYNRVRIIMDWLLSLVFGRDITYLRLMK